MPAIEFRGVSKRFPNVSVMTDLSFSVGRGELLWLSGPSGSGKTTLLRLIAGLELPEQGTILLNEAVATGPGVYLPPSERHLGMVFQDLALWPHMTVERHLDFVLKAQKADRSVRRTCIADLLELGGLRDRSRDRPAELSGGQQQRLAVLRALAAGPRVLLLDEPTAHQDALHKGRIFDEILRRKQANNVTVVVAAHDGDRIISAADQVLFLGGEDHSVAFASR